MSLTTLLLPPVSLTTPPIYTLTLTSPPDHRLTPSLLASFLAHLDDIERDWLQRREQATKAAKEAGGTKNYLGLGGAVVIRGEGEKFFSNGLDYANSLKDPEFHINTFSPFISRLLTFPLITIAAINGHCFAGGFATALACDFRIMRGEDPPEGNGGSSKRRAWCCMNEIDFGAPFPPLFASLLLSRIPPSLLRSCLLGVRFTPSVLLNAGVVDSLASSDADLNAQAHGLAEQWGGKAAGGVWGEIKRGVWKEVVRSGMEGNPRMPWVIEAEARERLGLGKGAGKAKL
ncbi:ClpP/crotonase-like domain-containing protein [Mrakia frigida]|uniref:ClpP/crotonase-like domain-containing protein n=1 Tax=Mrakia frigida TaxID=29902 RepID=UPI003FCC02C0